MEGPKLNEECCFSCLEPFEAARSEINISENIEVLKRILEVNFLLDQANDTMNLCIPCYNSFKECKEEYSKLKELETRFNAKRKKFAFAVVKSVLDDDYLGTSIENNFVNVRAKIYAKWQKEYKAQLVKGEESLDECNGIAEEVNQPLSSIAKPAVVPVKINPIQTPSTPIVKSVVSLQNVQGVKNDSPVPLQRLKQVNPAPGQKRNIIYVKRDPLTGTVTQVGNVTQMKYRLGPGNKIAQLGSPVRLANPQGRPNNIVQLQKERIAVAQSVPQAQPQGRPIVRTPIITAAAPAKLIPKPVPKASPPLIVARKSLPQVSTPKPATNSKAVEIKSRSDDESPPVLQQSSDLLISPDKKKRKKIVSQTETSPTQLTQLSNRSRRIIKKPVDSSCLYGNEYEKAVKNSSKKHPAAKARASKRNSDAALEMDMGEDSYRYDMGEDQEEMEEGTIDQFEEDDNMNDEPREEVSDVEN